MSEMKSTIAVEVDASGVQTGVSAVKKSLAALGEAATSAGVGFNGVSTQVDEALKKADRSTKAFVAQVKNAATDIKAEVDKLSIADKFELKAVTKGLDPAVYKPYVEYLRTVVAEQNRLAVSTNGVALSAGQLKNAIRGVPAQFTDIVTSLASGQSAMTVFMQQGGQLKDMFGGVGNAAKAFGSYVLGLINPISVTVAAVGAFGYAAYAASKDVSELQKALILSGSQLGTSVSQMHDVARGLTGLGVSSSAASAALVEFIGAGAKVNDKLKDVTKAAIDLERLGGVAIEETAKKFVALTKDPLADLDRLTLATYEQIKALLEQGKRTEAVAVAQNAFNESNKETVKALAASLGPLDVAASAWKRYATAVWDSVKAGASATAGAFAPVAGDDERKELQRRRDLYAQQGYDTTKEDARLAYFAQIDLAQKQTLKNVEQENTEKLAQIALDKEHDKYLSKAVQAQREISAAYQAFSGSRKTPENTEKYVETVKGILEKYKEKAVAKEKEELGTYADTIKAIREKIEVQTQEAAGIEKLTQGERNQAKFLADLRDGTAGLVALRGKSVQVQAAEIVQLFQAQIALEQQNLEIAKAEVLRKSALQAMETYTKKQADETAAINTKALAIEDEVKAYGLTKEALRQLTITRLQDEAAQITRYEPADVAQKEVAAIEARIAAIKRLGAAETALEAKDAATKAAHKAEEEWKRAAEKINESITDALMRGFESGKGFAENLRDTVVNMFKTLVLRPTVSAIVNPVAQGLTGALGLAGTANAAGAAGNALPFLGAGGLGGALMGGAGWMTGATTLGGALSAGASLLGTGTVAGGLSGLGMIAGALGPIGLGIAALSMIGNKDTPTASTGNASARYDALGNRTDYQTYYGGSSAGVDAMLANLQASYAATAKSLGIIAQATSFSYGGNTGKDGAAPNFALGGGAGNVSFYQGETASSDAAISLAASRAVFAALQGSDLPAYLSKVFDGITASTATQEQITNTLAYAQSLKQVRDALLETREPLQILKDNVAQGFATLATSADTFKADFVAAIDAGITPDKLAQWQGLQTAMTQLAQASGKATEAVKEVGRSIADIASERTRLQDQLDELTMTSAQLLDKQRNAIDDSNKSLFDQVQAQIQLKDAAQAVADAQVAAANAQVAAANAQIAAAEALRAAASQRLSTASAGAADALSALNRAVAAQKAQETAALAAQKAAAEAIYKAQASALQTSMDTAKASLDAVTNSVGKLKSLSGSLRSTLDGMRIAGSDGAYRANAQAQISAALAKARSGGGLPLDGQLASALAIVSKPSEQLFATFEDYARDFYKTANDISALADLTDSQLSADEVTQAILQEQSDKLSAQQRTLKDGFADQVSSLDAILSTAQQQLDAANGLDVSVLSIADALNQFNASVLKLANERAAQGLPTTAGVADGRAVAIRDYITSAASTLSGSELANTIAAKAKEVGVSEAEIASSIGWAKSKVREFFAGAGIPQFDVGTDYVPRDMLAMIHEGERITPKAYNPAAGGSGNADLIAEIRALREEVRQLQQSSSTTATATKKTAAMIETATEGGRAMLTETYT